MNNFFDDWFAPTLLIILIVVMTWRICHNIKDPNCESNWEAMTNWTCEDKKP